jgi:putative oxidoreductase
MRAFEDFLEVNGFPVPLFSAMLSVYAQLVCGILIISGFYIRIASLVMIINFLIALIIVHRQDSFEAMTPALAILFANILFLFYGAGKYSYPYNSDF